MKRLLLFSMLCTILMLPVEAAAGIALVSSSSGTSTVSSTVTSSAINTTGATLIVVTCSSKATISSVSNSGTTDNWSLLPTYGSAAYYVLIAYTYAPITSASQTFTCNVSSATYNFMTVTAWSGTLTTNAVYQTSVGSSAFSPGSITPITTGELFVSGITTANSTACYAITPPVNFTETVVGGGCPNSASNYNRDDGAYYVNSGSGTVNPTWTLSGSALHEASTMAAFLPASSASIGFDGGTFETSELDPYGIWEFSRRTT